MPTHHQAGEFTGVWIPRHILEDAKLKPVDRIIYTEIACFNKCSMSNETLAERAGCSPATVKRSISKLKEIGYVKQVAFDGRQRILSCRRDEPAQNEPAAGAICTEQTAQNEPLDNNIDNIQNTVGTNVPTAEHGHADINYLFEYWQHRLGYPITARVQANRRACYNMMRKHGRSQMERVIDGVAVAQADRYAPRISDFADLQSNWNKLMEWGKKRNNNGGIVQI